MFDHHLMKLNYAEWQKEAENERLSRVATSGRPGIQERLLLGLAGLFVSFGLWLGARYRPHRAGQRTSPRSESPGATLD